MKASAAGDRPRASIVIPTRDRRESLRAGLDAIAVSVDQAGERVEVIVVDDGSEPPLRREDIPAGIELTIVRETGRGPAAARNVGIRQARGDLIIFTDDDTVPVAGWVSAAIDHLASHAESVGVEGPVHSRDWDPLREHSVRSDGPGSFVTANIAFRREVLLRIGGFRPDLFRYAHAEDRDLAVRAMRDGPIGWDDRMAVDHVPRPVRLRHVIRQARWTADDIVLFREHPELAAEFRLPVRMALVKGAATSWLARAADGRAPSPARLARAIAYSATAGTVALWSAAQQPHAPTPLRQGAGWGSER